VGERSGMPLESGRRRPRYAATSVGSATAPRFTRSAGWRICASRQIHCARSSARRSSATARIVAMVASSTKRSLSADGSEAAALASASRRETSRRSVRAERASSVTTPIFAPASDGPATKSHLRKADQWRGSGGTGRFSQLLRQAKPRPYVVQQVHDRGVAERRGEVERPGCEYLRARGSLVVRHLRSLAGPEQVGDLCQHLQPRG
jgi:hypothetical protein